MLACGRLAKRLDATEVDDVPEKTSVRYYRSDFSMQGEIVLREFFSI